MSSRGFLLRTHDDDSFDQHDMRPLSPNIIVSRRDFFTVHDSGKTYTSSPNCISDVIQSILRFRAIFYLFLFDFIFNEV